jgi:hypothetical protein
MITNLLSFLRAYICLAFILCNLSLFGQSTTLNLTMQDAQFPTQFNSGGDFYNSGSTELGMWANNNAKQTVAWRNFNSAGDNTGLARALQIGDEFSITVRCTRAFGQIGFSLNAGGTQGGSYANNVNGSKLRINTDNFGSWYISNGSTSSSFNYNPSENIYRDYTFNIKILSPTLVNASLYVDGILFTSVQNFSLLSTNQITAFSIYGSDMWDGNSNDDAFWKACSVTSTNTVELGYALTSGNITPGIITNGLSANSASTSVTNAVFVGGNAGTSVIFNQPCTYSGLTSVNQNATLQLNNNGGGTLPNSNSVTVNGTLKISSNQTLADLTINNGGTVIVDPNVQLTINGTLSNSGTFTMESGATLVQGSSSTLSGSGSYVVKQDITGAGSSTPTGRFWYLGSPVSQASSAVFFASSLANVAKKRDEAANAWVSLNSGSAENLEVGRGYYIQTVPSSSTLNFTGGAINNGTITTPNLTSAGTSFTGFNLVSNPYPSYVDWTSVSKTNVGTTMWYRTHDGSGMNFGTVNGSGVGTTIGSTILTKYIPPMQSFWVRVATYGQPASLTFNNTNRSHFISENNSVAGLKSSNDSPSVFIRMNLKQAEKMDQLVVYTEDQATNGLDYLDAEKMMQATHPQFYTKVGNQKTVINALNAAKKQQALPITMELPITGVHSFVIEDLEISNGWVWLEDKQEEIIQALEPGTVYQFYANAGMNAERFVLHFQLIDDAVPTIVYNEVNSSANFSGKGANVYAESAGVVVIKLPASAEGVTDIQIRDAAGKVVYAGSMNNLETSVELAQANGIYYVTLSSNTGVEVHKVFIQQ